MSEFIGRSISFGVATEGTRGTAETAATKWVRKTVANIIPRSERVIDDTSFGRLEDADRVRTVRKWNEGSLEGILHADVVGYFFLNLYGDVESAPSGQAFTHAFTLNQTLTHPTLTLFVKDEEVRDVKMAGGVISSLEVTVATDNYVRYKADFMGKEEDTADSTPTVDVEYDFVSRDVSVKLADTEENLSSAEALKVKNLTITWNSNAISDYVVGNYSPDNIYNGTFSIEGTFTRNYTDQTFEDMYKGDDFSYMQIAIEGEADIATDTHPTITVLLNKVQITDWSRAGGQNELVTEEVSFKAFYNAEDEQQSEVSLLNLTEEYVAEASA